MQVVYRISAVFPGSKNNLISTFWDGDGRELPFFQILSFIGQIPTTKINGTIGIVIYFKPIGMFSILICYVIGVDCHKFTDNYFIAICK